MKKTTEDHSEDVRGMVKKTTEDLWEEAADSFNRLETFRNLAIQNERECAEPFGYWFKQERRFADLEEAERYFYVGETRELLKPLFTFPPAPQASVIPSSFESECWKEANNYLTAAVMTEIERKVLVKGLPAAPRPCQSKSDALEALDNMDDYARMDIGVDAIGPRKVLEDYINQPCPGCESSIAIMEMHCAKVRSQAAEIAKLKEVIAKCEEALDSCDVDDCDFPMDTQYYNAGLVDKALAATKEIEK